MAIGSIIKDVSRYTNTYLSVKNKVKYRREKSKFVKYDKSIYPCEIRIYFGNQFKDRCNKITEEAVYAVNRAIRKWIATEYLLYIADEKINNPDRMYKDHIYAFCEKFGLMVNDTFFETLKKSEYRHRKKNESD